MRLCSSDQAYNSLHGSARLLTFNIDFYWHDRRILADALVGRDS